MLNMATRKVKANFFDLVPPEIILRTLDFMWPDEYSGFTCTCRHALELVNAKWASNNHDCFQYRDATVSLTGAWLRWLREYRKQYESEGCYTVDEDPDLQTFSLKC